MTLKTTQEPLRELAQRTSDGIEVTLLWSPADGRLTVSVADGRYGEAFVLDAAADEALDVFNHPYAYAAHRGVDYETPWLYIDALAA